jgi:hypothetical protein
VAVEYSLFKCFPTIMWMENCVLLEELIYRLTSGSRLVVVCLVDFVQLSRYVACVAFVK